MPFLHIAKQRKLCKKYPDVPFVFLWAAHMVVWKDISRASTFPFEICSVSLVSYFAGSLYEL